MENIKMTVAQENMAKYKVEIEGLVKKYNDLDRKNTKQADIDKIVGDIEKAVKGYNDNSWSQMIIDVKGAEDPMKAAILKFTYPVLTIKDKNVGDKDAPVYVREISQGSKVIDIKKVHAQIPNGIGHDVRWFQMIEKFNLLMTIRVATDVKAKDAAESKSIAKTIAETFGIAPESKEIPLTADVISNNKMIQAVQLVVTAMIGEGFKCTSHDSKFIEWRYGKKSRNRLCVTCSTSKELMETMMHVCNKLLTDGTYEAEYKKA
jgi:hypothetical protein